MFGEGTKLIAWGEDGSLTWGMGGFCGAHMKETEAKESQGGGQMAGLRNGTHCNPVKILSAKDMRLPSPPGAPFGVYDSTLPCSGTDVQLTTEDVAPQSPRPGSLRGWLWAGGFPVCPTALPCRSQAPDLIGPEISYISSSSRASLSWNVPQRRGTSP